MSGHPTLPPTHHTHTHTPHTNIHTPHTHVQSVTALDNSFWDRFWSDPTLTPQDYFTLITFQDIRDLRDKASGNLTALCFKARTVGTVWLLE